MTHIVVKKTVEAIIPFICLLLSLVVIGCVGYGFVERDRPLLDFYFLFAFLIPILYLGGVYINSVSKEEATNCLAKWFMYFPVIYTGGLIVLLLLEGLLNVKNQ